MQLDQIPLRQKSRIAAIDWAGMSESEGHRLRSLGVEVGARVEALHRGILFFRDPLSLRIGRMTIALRCAVAAAITIEIIEE